MTALIQYFRDSLEELHKVRWPTRQQAVRLSIVVLIFCTVSALAFGLFDTVFGEMVKIFLSAII